MRRFTSVLIVLSLLGGLEAPAVALQSYAWASMLVRGLRAGASASTLAETFDGRHPCALCLRAARAGASQCLRAAFSPAKPDFFPPRRRAPLAARGRGDMRPRVFASAAGRPEPPPVPPPKTRLA
jgi:hypothetical protein